MCRRTINAQLSPLFISVETQDIIDDLIGYKERMKPSKRLKFRITGQQHELSV